MKKDFLELEVNTKQTVLSSKSLFYKTEKFISETKYILNIDYLLSKVCETILIYQNEILLNEPQTESKIDCFMVETQDKEFTFIFKFGFQLGLNLNKYDIVLFDYVTKNVDEQTKHTVNEYVKLNQTIKVAIKKYKQEVKLQDFAKLYLISNKSGVNLPRLNLTQKQIVETVDKNILVQGVAGSGKTNICIDKIIFTACKNFTGKVLYTTFSRGLLIDTKLKVESYKQDLEQVLQDYKNNNILFLDNNHKKALQNKVGIYFFSDDDDEIIKKLEKVIYYLSNKVDYYLIEDLYKLKFNYDNLFANQTYFINTYSKNLTNHQIEKAFSKLSGLSKEIIYKEIYGMIFGFYNLETKPTIMPLNEYINLRQNSFNKQECETIYQIASDYFKHLQNKNLLDNNIASRKLINEINNFEYSLSVIDEVQDYTQVNLCLFKKLSLKMFCVGDALQMVNPSYFNFGYLKTLLFEKDVADVMQLKHNYRNSAKIEEIINSLGEINRLEFGTHNFVLKGESVDNGIKTTAVFINGNNFLDSVANSKFDNFTVVVASDKEKRELQKILKNQEVLTVSEIKGLERDTVVVYNLLSSNLEKWNLLSRNKVNHKQADENSVFRYYYNLFYVGLTRAKQNLFVYEQNQINQFTNFFTENFEVLDVPSAISVLTDIVKVVEFTEQEAINRIEEFVRLEQYENARFAARKIKNDVNRINAIRTIEINENLIRVGKYREAGVKFWEYGMIAEAKKQFVLSGDTILIELMDTISSNKSDLNIDIISYFSDVKDNKVATEFIINTVKKDVENLKQEFNDIKQKFIKGRK